MNRSSPCDRGPLVLPEAHYYTAAHECDGYSDCVSGEDELWQAGPDRIPCGGTPALALAGALRCAAWLALLAVCSVWWWKFSHRRDSVQLFAAPFAVPFLGGCCVGPVATLVLVAPAPWAAGRAGLLLGDQQCAAPVVLALGLTAVLGGLTLQVWHTVRHTGQPLQAQMAAPSKSAAAPLVAAVVIQIVTTGVAIVFDPWRTRSVPDPLDSGVRCACTRPATAAVIFSVHTFVVGATLLAGVWLALGPGRAVSKKFRFYPWMQQCSTVASAILVWFICLLAAVINLARSDLPWSHLPTTNAIAFAYNVAVLLSLPVLWMPKAAALTRSLQAKHDRVTELHSLISANSAPCVIDRGTGTLAQGRFRRSRSARPAARAAATAGGVSNATAHSKPTGRFVLPASESDGSEDSEFEDAASMEEHEQLRP